jgi:hypothetical protein
MASKRSKAKILGFAIPAVPLIGYAWKLHVVWPPLGSIEVYAATSAVAIIAALGALPGLFGAPTSAKKWATGGILAALLPLGCYAFLLTKYVKAVETPNNGTQYRTIGGQLTPLALKTYPGESPEGILAKNGLTDGDIERMWTPTSVECARLELFLSYVLTLGLFNFARGSLAKAAIRSKQGSAKKSKEQLPRKEHERNV